MVALWDGDDSKVRELWGGRVDDGKRDHGGAGTTQRPGRREDDDTSEVDDGEARGTQTLVCKTEMVCDGKKLSRQSDNDEDELWVAWMTVSEIRVARMQRGRQLSPGAARTAV
jgi:hypothetical protein